MVGLFLGGVAKGLESAQASRQREKELALRELGLSQQFGLGERALDIREKELAASQQNDLLSQADKIISSELKIVGDVITESRKAGQTPEQIAKAVEPILADIDALSAKTGRDPSRIRQAVNAQINVPVALEGPKVGGTVEGIKSKIAAGQPLSEGERQLYQDSLKSSADDLTELFRELERLGKKPTAEAPAPAAPAAPAATPTPTTQIPLPPVPSALAGKPGLQWSAKRQRWRDAAGNQYNQQGVPVSP